MSSSDNNNNTNTFFGWRVVAATFILALFGWGIGFYGPPIYLHTVQAAHGWPLALASAAVTLHFLVGAFVVANLPCLYRRFGVPAVTLGGALALAAGVLGWALARQPWQLFAAALFSGAGWVAMGAAAVNAILAPWFVRSRAKALAMAYNGASVGGVVFAPLWVAAIEAFGFATAAALVGAVMVLVVGLLCRHVFSRTPQELGQVPDGDAPGAAPVALTDVFAKPLPGPLLWRDRRFLTLAAGMACGLVAQIGLVAHLFSVMTPALGAQRAGWAMGLATACAIAGRTLVGWLLPPGADRRLVACASYAVQMAGTLLLIASGGTQIPLLLTGLLLFGLGIGNATSLPPLIAQVEFVKEEVARVVALIVALAQAAYAFAPLGFAVAREMGGNTGFFAMVAGVQAMAMVFFLAGRRTGRQVAIQPNGV